MMRKNFLIACLAATTILTLASNPLLSAVYPTEVYAAENSDDDENELHQTEVIGNIDSDDDSDDYADDDSDDNYNSDDSINSEKLDVTKFDITPVEENVTIDSYSYPNYYNEVSEEPFTKYDNGSDPDYDVIDIEETAESSDTKVIESAKIVDDEVVCRPNFEGIPGKADITVYKTFSYHGKSKKYAVGIYHVEVEKSWLDGFYKDIKNSDKIDVTKFDITPVEKNVKFDNYADSNISFIAPDTYYDSDLYDNVEVTAKSSNTKLIDKIKTVNNRVYYHINGDGAPGKADISVYKTFTFNGKSKEYKVGIYHINVTQSWLDDYYNSLEADNVDVSKFKITPVKKNITIKKYNNSTEGILVPDTKYDNFKNKTTAKSSNKKVIDDVEVSNGIVSYEPNYEGVPGEADITIYKTFTYQKKSKKFAIAIYHIKVTKSWLDGYYDSGEEADNLNDSDYGSGEVTGDLGFYGTNVKITVNGKKCKVKYNREKFTFSATIPKFKPNNTEIKAVFELKGYYKHTLTSHYKHYVKLWSNPVPVRNSRSFKVKAYKGKFYKGDVFQVNIMGRKYKKKVTKDCKTLTLPINAPGKYGKKVSMVLNDKFGKKVASGSTFIYYSRNLSKGMTMDQVKWVAKPQYSVLFRTNVTMDGGYTYWWYQLGHYIKFYNGKIVEWGSTSIF